jgi:hypothetical protein
MQSRACERPEPSALGWRSETSASTVTKFNDCTKPVTIRCASLSDRAPAPVVTRSMGLPPGSDFRKKTPATGFQTRSKGLRLRMTSACGV